MKLAFVLLVLTAVAATAAAEVQIARSDTSGPAPLSRAELQRVMRQDPNAAIRIVPVFDWSRPARDAILRGRDCVSQPATCRNGSDGITVAYGDAASVPDTPTRGTVLTDSACEPDSVGASHCRNRIRIPNGRVLDLRNDHRLANAPCLSPGEHVLLVPGDGAAASLASYRRAARDRAGAWPAKTGAQYGLCKVSAAGLGRAGITRKQLACAIPS